MSERMTGIHLPSLGMGSGWQEYGRKTRAEMIYRFRRNAQIQLEEAQRILDAADEEFVVETYLGPIAMRNREPVQDSDMRSA